MVEYSIVRFSKEDLLADEWEVKPEPRELWVVEYGDDSVGFYFSKEESEECESYSNYVRTVKFVEVIE